MSDPAADRGPLLRAEELTVRFPAPGHSGGRRQVVHALDDVSLELEQRQVLGVIGESGSGKTTLGLTLLRYHTPTSGRIYFRGEDITNFGRNRLRRLRRHIQMIYQDPHSSLNPRMTIGESVGEPLRAHDSHLGRAERQRRVREVLDLCGVPPSVESRHPGAFSGGQRQRICIARALVLKPQLIIADEPTSALDVSIQAQIVNLLDDVSDELGLALVFISHDLAVVRHISDRVMIMYAGRVVEAGPTDAVFRAPQHPYTQALLSAVPVADRSVRWADERIILEGEMPSPVSPPTGCRFHTRCQYQSDRCVREVPYMEVRGVDHEVACWNVDQVSPVLPPASRVMPPHR